MGSVLRGGRLERGRPRLRCGHLLLQRPHHGLHRRVHGAQHLLAHTGVHVIFSNISNYNYNNNRNRTISSVYNNDINITSLDNKLSGPRL